MLELCDRAVEEQYGGRSRRAGAERRAALAGKLAELEAERKGYLRQSARGVLSDGELDVDPRFVTGAGPSGLCPIRSVLHR